MPAIAEQWFEEGWKEEMKYVPDCIEYGLEFKFGKDGLMLMPEIRKIHDSKVFSAIMKKMWTADNPDELRAIYQDA